MPLTDAETVFRTVARELGPYLPRIPDGETGNRIRWIWWQREMLLHIRQWSPIPTRHRSKFVNGTVHCPYHRLVAIKPGIDPATVTFDTGYAAAARELYAVFRRLRDAGEIPAAVRFQVCLPTPMASGYMHVSPSSLAAYLPIYERYAAHRIRRNHRCDPASGSVDPMGRVPGGPGVRALLSAHPPELQSRHRRRTRAPG